MTRENGKHQPMTPYFVDKLVVLKTRFYPNLNQKEKDVLDDRIAAFKKYKFSAVVTEKQKFMLSRMYDEQVLLGRLEEHEKSC
jgi:hypothetical protein